ncbi:MAG: PAS domain S-box protein, partial [Candidatus Methanomethylicaceae archaeon]
MPDDFKYSGSSSEKVGQEPTDLELNYKELVEIAKSIIFKWDAEGKVIWMNEYGLKFFGFSKEEVFGRSVYETFVPKVESTGRDLSTLVRDVFEDEERYTTHINENVKKDGTRVWIHWSNKPIKNERGERVAIISIGMDITDRIKIERMQEYELKKSRALSRLYELLVSPKVSIDEIERVILEEAKVITESKCGFIGRLDSRTGEFVSGIVIQEHECKMKEKKILLHDATGRKPNSLIDYALSYTKAFYTNSPKEHFAYKGVPEWHIAIERFLAVPINVDGKTLGLVALANSRRDYEERDLEAVLSLCRYFVLGLQKMRYEEELVLKEEFYKTLFENAPVPTLLIDEDETISNINSAFERFSGYTKEEVEGKRTWKEFVYPDDLKRMEFYRSERLSGRYAPSSYEFRFLDRCGNVHEALINVAIIPGTRKIIAAFLDLTEIKKLQEDLKRYSAELEKYSKHLEELVEERTRELKDKERLAAIGHTATMVGHDLRNPLQVMKNMIYTLNEKVTKAPIDPTSKSEILEKLKVMDKQIGYMNKIVLDLQDL